MKNNFLTGLELSTQELTHLLEVATQLKKDRLAYKDALKNKHLALLFDKPSFRTRSSFTVAMRELGGDVIESVQFNRKNEDPEDQIRVIQGYVHAVMIRTFEDEILEKMVPHATIPIINGLSDLHHPCQTLADLLAIKERFGDLEGRHICYVGDGNNILHSLMLIAPKAGVHVHYCCPPQYGPNAFVCQTASDLFPDFIHSFDTPIEAVKNCDAIYTDVWSSMGFDQRDESAFEGYQVNDELLSFANDDAVAMHCMPMERGKEISQTLPDGAQSIIFDQAENRLHAQKALLYILLGDT